MNALLEVLEGLSQFQSIKTTLTNDRGFIQVVGSASSQRSHIINALSQEKNYKLIIAPNETRARSYYEEYKLLSDNVFFYPAKDLLFYHVDIKGKELLEQRMEVMKHLMEQPEATIILVFDALMDKLPNIEEIKRNILQLKVGESISLDIIKNQLVNMGYESIGQVDSVGQFCVRGGILDIFPLTQEVPVRIEFWDEEIDSIRSFNIETQRSIENLEFMSIYPAGYTKEGEENLVSFLDYFNPKETLLFLEEPMRLIELAQSVEEEFIKSTNSRMEEGLSTPKVKEVIHTTKEILSKLKNYKSIGFTTLNQKLKEFDLMATYYLEGKRINAYNNSFETLTRDLKRLKREKYKVVLLSASTSRAKRLAQDLRDYDLSSFYSETLDHEIKESEILVTQGFITEGYEYKDVKFMVITESDIFGRSKKKKKKHSHKGQKISAFHELNIGDYVVHENHGLGIYQGIEKIERDKISKDYMKISYAGDGNLYIPATQLNLIQKYASATAKKPKLNRLGSKEWLKTKTRVKGEVKEIAHELVKLYAARQEEEGFQYGPDTIWQREFEEMFPYEETIDQLQAIEDTKKDMESKKIMDRLICGDVGYGKTEIAIRAAFKAVQESKQVVYLVPTTILAQQHYNTFINRMKDFPVRIDLMCRFRTPTQQKETIKDTQKGSVDIIVGTHRLLSKDMKYKNLGLLIIDEEQRFGVTHKEKIKQLKENIDVLTLSATPIPRTLHMSLVGIRDMSVLEEAPQERMPIQTYVMEYNDEMVREAIERELARDGQVYYVYNKVSDIDEITSRIQRLVPQARVSFAHGQMKEQELEAIMYEFIEGDIDVLVSTTIIETGLDIGNANTMIIHDSDRLGLSQLYQLRGRVGRSNRMAYAFLLYKRDKMLKEVAEKRLSAIREFTDLGSGFKVAMRDLEIRGAGNLLGASQHGHMEALGYDLYCKMLNEAVRIEKGEISEDIYETSLELNIEAFIPASYIPNEQQKLDIYKRIAAIESEEEKEDMLEELIDRYGDVPKKVQQLLSIAQLRTLAHSAYLINVEHKGEKIKFTMYEKSKVDASKIPLILKKYEGDLNFKVETNPYFIYDKVLKNNRHKKVDVLENVKNIINDIKTLII